MKNISILLVLLVGLSISISYAQNYSFKVLAIKGPIKVKVLGEKWNVLKTGAKLNAGDRLKLANDNYVGLFHSSGKTLEITEAGVYDISEISSKMGDNSQSIVSKYTDFVISKMTPEAIEENRKKYASVTGSGERGVFENDIQLYAPKTTKVYNKKAKISWTYDGKDNIYVISIKNILGEKLLTAETSTPQYIIDFENEKITKSFIMNFVMIDVALKSDPSIISQQVAIKLIDDDERKGIDKTLDKLFVNMNENSSINNLILAQYYEEEGLLLDASNSYANAILLAPKVDFYRESYSEFLIRNGFKKP